MDLEQFIIQMVVDMKDFGRMIKYTEKGHCIMQMENQLMKGIGFME